jgi:hypothetical protein
LRVGQHRQTVAGQVTGAEAFNRGIFFHAERDGYPATSLESLKVSVFAFCRSFHQTL